MTFAIGDAAREVDVPADDPAVQLGRIRRHQRQLETQRRRLSS